MTTLTTISAMLKTTRSSFTIVPSPGVNGMRNPLRMPHEYGLGSRKLSAFLGQFRIDSPGHRSLAGPPQSSRWRS